MDQPLRTSLLLPAFAGLASGVLTVIVPLPVPLYIKSGFFFGLAITTYFALYEECRAFAKLGVFVLVCSSACPISALSAYYAIRFLTGGDLSGAIIGNGSNLPAPALFFAGFVGASLVLISANFFFGPQENDLASLVRALVWSVCGGVLGLTEKLGGTTPVVFLIWPTGVGLALSAMLRMERRSIGGDSTLGTAANDSPISEKNWALRIAVGTVLVCTIGFLGRLVYYELKWDRMRTAMEAAQEKVINEMPSTQSLPPIVPVKLDDALVLTPISGFVPRTKDLRPDHLPLFHNLPFFEYYGDYVLPEELSHGDTVRVVEVRLWETPNYQWASYISRLPDSGNYLEAQSTVTQVVKFRQKIVKDDSRDYGLGIECFHWPSQSFAVSVCFANLTVKEEFLRIYLQKYPSSW